MTVKTLDHTTCPTTADVGAVVNQWIAEEKARAGTSQRPYLRLECEEMEFQQDTQINAIDITLHVNGNGPGDLQGWYGPYEAGTYFKPRNLPTNQSAFYFSGQGARGSRIYNISFFDNRAINSSNIVSTAAFNHLISIKGVAGEVELDKIHMPRVKNGIWAETSGRLKIGSLTGDFLDNIITLEDMQDACYIDRIHDWSYDLTDAGVFNYKDQNKYSVVLGRCDGLFVGDFFSQHSDVALFLKHINQAGPASKIMFSHFFAEYTRLAVNIAAANREGNTPVVIGNPATYPGNAIGSHLAFGNFTTHHWNLAGQYRAGGRAVNIDASRAYVQIANSRVDGSPLQEFAIAGGRYGTAVHVASHIAYAPAAADRSFVGAAPAGAPGNAITFAVPPIVVPYGNGQL